MEAFSPKTEDRQEDGEEAVSLPFLSRGMAQEESNKDVNQLGESFAGERGTVEQGIIQRSSFERMGYI